jgi:transposase-like protein
MKNRKRTPEQIIRELAEGEKLLGEGQNIEEVSRHLEITESTWHRWRNQYGGMKADDAKKLKELEKENQRLKKIVADQAVNIDMLKDRHWKLLTPGSRRRAASALQTQFGLTERRACRVVGQPRSTQRLKPPDPTDDELALRAFLRDFAKQRPAGAGDGRWWPPNRPGGGPTTSGPTVSGSQKVCVCPTGSGRSPSGASARRSVPCAPSGPTWSGPWTSSSTRPERGGRAVQMRRPAGDRAALVMSVSVPATRMPLIVR